MNIQDFKNQYSTNTTNTSTTNTNTQNNDITSIFTQDENNNYSFYKSNNFNKEEYDSALTQTTAQILKSIDSEEDNTEEVLEYLGRHDIHARRVPKIVPIP